MATGARKDRESRRAWIALPWIAIAPLLVGAAGCSAPVGGPGDEATATASSPIYGGVEDNDAQQNASVVAVKVGDGSTFELCSGALIAPNIVLTARHCVSVQSTTSVSCDQNGNSLSGDNFSGDQPVAAIHVFVGPTPNLLGTPAANAAALFHPAGNVLCNADVALVVLDAKITSVPPMRVRLSSPVEQAESVRSVGYGQNDQNLPIGTRFRKDGVAVLAVGSTVSASMTALGSNEFEVGESICEGDSGGPAIDEKTGAIVGVVSRGGACTDDFGHVYTSLAGFQSVFQQAFAMAGGAPIDENAPASGDGGAATDGTGSAYSSSGGSSSGGGTVGGTTHYAGPVNLHAGQGATCSAAGAPGGAGRAPGGIALAGIVAFATLRTRRRVR
jgi:MYXO-CTERM domain-containing protein